MVKKLFCVFILLPFSIVQAQQIEPGLVGTDFWLSFLHNYGSSTKSILIASEYDCTAYIEAPLLSWDTTVSITAGSTTRVIVPITNSQMYFDGIVTPYSWHIVTSEPAVVYASNYISHSHDMTAIMPTPSLRNDYITQTYGSREAGQQIAIVAPYDNTHIHIVFAEKVYQGFGDNILFYPGDETDLVLMRGEVYHLSSNCTFSGGNIGFSGTSIQSSKPVAVFQGHSCPYIPSSYFACDHIYEQAIPTDFWGRHFVVMPTTNRHQYDHYSFVGDLVKITARDDNCVIFIEGQPVDTLNSGNSYSFYLSNHIPVPATVNLDFYQSEALSIYTSSPVMVVFYITGASFGGTPGDPASVVVPPLNQAIGRTTSVVYNTNSTSSHFVNIVTPTTDTAGIMVDGTNIASSFTSLSNGYSYARITTNEGTHIIDAGTGHFLATFYGLGGFESYAYIAGMANRSAEYNVYADRYTLCRNDSVSITFTPIDVGLSVAWNVDGHPLNYDGNTLRIGFDSEGLHRVAVVVNPVCDTVWEYITVFPAYNFQEYDTILQGQTFYWRGRAFTEEDIYIDSMVTRHGCDSMFTLHLLVLGNRPLDITTDASGDDICPGDTVHLYAMPDTALVHWISTPHDPSLDAQSTQHAITVSPAVTTTYTALENLPNGPAITISVTETNDLCLMVNTPSIMVSDDPLISINNCSTGVTFSHWTLSDGREFYNNDLHCYLVELFDDSIAVNLQTCWQNCCKDTSITLPIIPFEWKFPNVITPNGDGINDVFAIENFDTGIYYTTICDGKCYNRLSIYNRWGKEVYDVKNYDTYALNGVIYPGQNYFDGNGLSEGTYFYTFEFHGKERTFYWNGTITILR